MRRFVIDCKFRMCILEFSIHQYTAINHVATQLFRLLGLGCISLRVRRHKKSITLQSDVDTIGHL